MIEREVPLFGIRNMIKAGKLTNKYVTKQGYKCKDCRRYPREEFLLIQRGNSE